MNAEQTLKLYEIANKYFKNNEDAKSFVQQV